MKFSKGLAAIAMLAVTATGHAEITGSAAIVSDYNWRGITQTSQDPAFQASLDWAGESGLYVGAWGSNVDFGGCCDENIEIDVYAGFAGGETITYDVGALYYAYPGADSIDFPEVYASLGYKWVTGKVSYSWDFGNSGDSAFYYELNPSIPLPNDVTFDLHVGYSDGDYWSDDDYVDYSVGLSKTFGNFTLGVKYVDGSDYKPGNDTEDDVSSSDAQTIFSVSTEFPWSDE